MVKFLHVVTGTLDTREGWVASYDREELEARGLTADEAFAADEGVTLIEHQLDVCEDTGFGCYVKV